MGLVGAAAAYAQQLRELLPPGLAWTLEAGSKVVRLLEGIAEEYARVDARTDALVAEMDPRTALETLADWERVLGLPDDCLLRLPSDVAERQVLATQKAVAIGGQTNAYLLQLLQALGYTVATINEFQPLRVGGRVGDRVNGLGWAHVIEVRVQVDINIRVLRVGSRVGERLRGWGAVDMECIIKRAAPAHVVVLFAYE